MPSNSWHPQSHAPPQSNIQVEKGGWLAALVGQNLNALLWYSVGVGKNHPTAIFSHLSPWFYSLHGFPLLLPLFVNCQLLL